VSGASVSEQQIETARIFMTALDKGDVSGMADLLGADFRFELMTAAPGFPSTLDRDGFLSGLTAVLGQLLPNGMNFTFGAAFSDGPHVSIQGESSTVTATGKTYANRYHWYFRFDGGKIVEFKEYMDSYQMLQAFADG
jgi:ketosteroid isomerase-like protein